MFDYSPTVISQYRNAPTLLQLIANLSAYIDPDFNLQNFYDQCWNLDTAVGYGLDVWGRRVGVNRTLTVASADFFGFTGAPGVESGDSFNAGIFYLGQPTSTNYALS